MRLRKGVATEPLVNCDTAWPLVDLEINNGAVPERRCHYSSLRLRAALSAPDCILCATLDAPTATFGRQSCAKEATTGNWVAWGIAARHGIPRRSASSAILEVQLSGVGNGDMTPGMRGRGIYAASTRIIPWHAATDGHARIEAGGSPRSFCASAISS